MAEITIPGMFLTGDHASRPAATAVGGGTLYSCTDDDLIYQSDGSAWSTWATVGGGAPAAIDVAVRVRRVADQALTNGSLVYVSWDAEDYDHSTPMHDLVTNPTRLTVPTGEGGKYVIAGSGFVTASAGNADCVVRKNGSTFVMVGWYFTHASISAFGFAGELELAAGDYLEWGIRVGAASKSLIDGGSADPFMSMRRVA